MSRIGHATRRARHVPPASGGAFSVATYPTLAAWWDPSDAVNVTVVSGAYSTIVDKSGQTARNLVQATAAARPSQAYLNTRYAMTLDGGDHMKAASFMFAGGSAVIAMVLRGVAQDGYVISEASTADGSRIYAPLIAKSTTVDEPDAYIQATSGSVQYPGYYDGTKVLFDNAAHTAVVVDSGTAITHYVDGVQSSSHAYTRAAMTLTDLYLGAQNYSGTLYSLFNGQIGEVIIARDVPTTLQRQQLEGYLAHRWGTQTLLAADHPYKAAPPA